MSVAANIHLAVTNPDLKAQIEKALVGTGFSVVQSLLLTKHDVLAATANDVFVMDREQVQKILSEPSETVIRIGDILELHTLNYEVICKGKKLDLTSSEFQMLKILCENRPRVLSREKLVEMFTGMGLDLSLRTIDNHIFNLRKKMGDCENLIQTIRGVGYKIQSI